MYVWTSFMTVSRFVAMLLPTREESLHALPGAFMPFFMKT